MSDNPGPIQINYTSFAQKEPYKPPTAAFFGQTANQKKPKYVPGGEWAQEEEPTAPSQKPGPVSHSTKPDAFQAVDVDLTNSVSPTDGGDAKPKSKFKFIQNKKDAPAPPSKLPNAVGVLEFSEVRADQ